MITTTKPCSFEQQLDESGITRPMWLLWLLSAGLIALDGFDFFVIGIALPFIEQDFGLDATTIGAIAVAAIVGSFVGSLMLGPLTDWIGRQRMLIIDIGIFVVATAATALAWDAVSLICFRFLVGIGIGADYPLSVAYITENVPARFRGRMVIGAFTFQAVGALLGAIAGLVVIYLFQRVYPDAVEPAIHYAWRWMLGIGLVGAIAVALLRFQFVLESPRYYIAQGCYESASEAATQLLEKPVTVRPELEPAPEPDMGYGVLFSQRFLRRMVFTSVPWFLQDIATYGIGIFTPVIIAALALSGEQDFMTRQFVATTGSAFVDLFLIVGFLLALLLVDQMGRIKLQVLGFIGMAMGLLCLAWSSFPGLEARQSMALVFVGFIVFNLLMNTGPNSTTFLLSGEVFPTAIRASGAGFAAAFAKVGAVFGTFALPILQRSLGNSVLLLVLSGVCMLAALVTYAFRVETTGRSLEAVGDADEPALSSSLPPQS